MPRYIYLLHANNESELGAATPAEISEMMEKMGAYGQSLKDAGLFVTADGFLASKEGARVTFSANSTKVQNGPFKREGLIRGYWIVRAKDLDEAIAWAQKAPVEDTTIEVRRFAELENLKDFLAEQSGH